MWKKRILCLALVICAALTMTACQQKETFPTTPQQPVAEQTTVTAAPEDPQNIFGDEPVASEPDYDDGSYDPTQEEGGAEETINIPQMEGDPTAAPTMQSEYAGATPVLIDPIDKPTPTPLPPLTFTYQTYTAEALKLTFEGPAGWEVDNSQTDSFTLTNTMSGMDYAAKLTIRLVPVSKNYTKNDLIKEVKNTLDTLSGEGFQKFERSNTAGRKFMNTDGIYANYSGTTNEGVKVAGRLIIACSEKMLYVLHVSYPQGYTKTYVDNVYDKFRHTVKKITAQ